jgi:hypothetical protein
MATFTEVNKYLSELPIGEHKLIDIVDKIMSITSKKHKTQLFLAKQTVTSEYRSRCPAIDLKDIWVDITYQRSLKLKKIYEHLQLTDEDENKVGFSASLCGTVEFAIRPNGKTFVWDGFRRCVISLIKGINCIPANIEIHPDNWSDRKCLKREAFWFTEKNSRMEPMKAEELFKAGCAKGTKKYLAIKEVLVECELDILQVNQGKTKLGGYVEFEKLVEKSPFSEGVTKRSNDFIVQSSKQIQNVWKGQEVSGFMLSGLSEYLYKNELDGENGNHYYKDETEIEEAFDYYVSTNSGTQSSCTKDRLHSMPRQSVAWRICINVMKMSAIDASKFLGFDDDQTDMLKLSH